MIKKVTIELPIYFIKNKKSCVLEKDIYCSFLFAYLSKYPFCEFASRTLKKTNMRIIPHEDCPLWIKYNKHEHI